MSLLAYGGDSTGKWPYLPTACPATRADRAVASMAVLLVFSAARPRRLGARGAGNLAALFVAGLKDLNVECPLDLGAKNLRSSLGCFPEVARLLGEEGYEPPGTWQEELFHTDAGVLRPELRAELLHVTETRLLALGSEAPHITYVMSLYPRLSAAQVVFQASLEHLAVIWHWALATPGPQASSERDVWDFYAKFPPLTFVMPSAGEDNEKKEEDSDEDNEKKEEDSDEDNEEKEENAGMCTPTGSCPRVASNAALTTRATGHKRGGGKLASSAPRDDEPAPNTGVPTCSYCNRKGHDVSACWKKSGACLRCGKQGHRAADCVSTRATTTEATEDEAPATGSDRDKLLAMLAKALGLNSNAVTLHDDAEPGSNAANPHAGLVDPFTDYVRAARN
jgi:hypothetical protein